MTTGRGVSPRLLIGLALIVPAVFAAVGAWLLMDAMSFDERALPVQAEVIAVAADYDPEGTTFRPVFRFTDAGGETREAPSVMSSSGYDYEIGAMVDILYDPGDPSEVRVAGVVAQYTLPVVFLVLGVSFFAIFGLVFWKLARGTRAGKEV